MEETSGESALRSAMTRRLLRRTMAKGEIRLPAVPAMLDVYVTMCADLFACFGATMSSPEELAHLRGALETELTAAFNASSRSQIAISYEAPLGMSVRYRVAPRWLSIEEAYDNWVGTRTPPLFGTEPDARVMALAAEAGDPAGCPALDIGAGTGRNALALARRGHPVDAMEMAEKFAEIIAEEARGEGLDVRVLRRNVFEKLDDLRTDYGLIVLAEVVQDFRGVEQLRSMFELAARCLAPGGTLLFNAFLPRAGYVPDDAARQLGQQVYTGIFTREELADALGRLPLELVADDSVYEYEKAHQPAESWPPTSWYEEWVSGQDLFDVPREDRPIESRWLVYRKNG